MHHRRQLGETDHDFLSRIAPDYVKMWKEKKAQRASRGQARATGRRLRKLASLIEEIAADVGQSEEEQDPARTLDSGDRSGARPTA